MDDLTRFQLGWIAALVIVIAFGLWHRSHEHVPAAQVSIDCSDERMRAQYESTFAAIYGHPCARSD
jgi:hypothetical protein